MKILLFGSGGQLGQALTKALNHLHKIHLSHRDICDLTKPSQIQNLIDHTKPDLILNAAAYNDVDAAENHYEEAFALNVNAPSVMAKKANELETTSNELASLPDSDIQNIEDTEKQLDGIKTTLQGKIQELAVKFNPLDTAEGLEIAELDRKIEFIKLGMNEV